MFEAVILVWALPPAASHTPMRAIIYISDAELDIARSALFGRSGWGRWMAGRALYYLATGQASWWPGEHEGSAILHHCVQVHKADENRKCCRLLRGNQAEVKHDP